MRRRAAIVISRLTVPVSRCEPNAAVCPRCRDPGTHGVPFSVSRKLHGPCSYSDGDSVAGVRGGRGWASVVDAAVVAMTKPGGKVLIRDVKDLQASAACARNVSVFAE